MWVVKLSGTSYPAAIRRSNEGQNRTIEGPQVRTVLGCQANLHEQRIDHHRRSSEHDCSARRALRVRCTRAARKGRSGPGAGSGWTSGNGVPDRGRGDLLGALSVAGFVAGGLQGTS